MDFLSNSFEFIRHFDVHLEAVMREYQGATYLILAAIVFCETGLVVTPFLPGDSLLFAAGAIVARTGLLDVKWLMLILGVASLLGDNVNYFLGKHLGTKVFEREFWFIRQSHLERTRQFYARHGGKTVVLARFLPILRTFAPFVAGVGAMQYRRFIGFSILASLLWVPSFTLLGYFFGQLPFVQNNFHWIIVAIIVVSLVPVVIEWYRHRVEDRPTV
jgi:membrane-associated protein